MKCMFSFGCYLGMRARFARDSFTTIQYIGCTLKKFHVFPNRWQYILRLYFSTQIHFQRCFFLCWLEKQLQTIPYVHKSLTKLCPVSILNIYFMISLYYLFNFVVSDSFLSGMAHEANHQILKANQGM